MCPKITEHLEGISFFIGMFVSLVMFNLMISVSIPLFNYDLLSFGQILSIVICLLLVALNCMWAVFPPFKCWHRLRKERNNRRVGRGLRQGFFHGVHFID